MAKNKGKTFIIWNIQDDTHFYIDPSEGCSTKLDALKFHIKDHYSNGLDDEGAFNQYQVYEISSWEKYEYKLSEPKLEFVKTDGSK